MICEGNKIKSFKKGHLAGLGCSSNPLFAVSLRILQSSTVRHFFQGITFQGITFQVVGNFVLLFSASSVDSCQSPAKFSAFTECCHHLIASSFSVQFSSPCARSCFYCLHKFAPDLSSKFFCSSFCPRWRHSCLLCPWPLFRQQTFVYSFFVVEVTKFKFLCADRDFKVHARSCFLGLLEKNVSLYKVSYS